MLYKCNTLIQMSQIALLFYVSYKCIHVYFCNQYICIKIVFKTSRYSFENRFDY